MDEKRSISILYDAAEDEEKDRADEQGKPFPLAYAQVAEALEKRGHQVQTIGVTKKIRSLVALIEKDTSDVIFNLCESIANSSQHEHNVVGLLELFQKCFTGCGSAGWLLASDKALCKKILQFHGLRYPRFCTIEKGKVDWSDDLEFPLIVKPLNEDASIGIDKGSVVENVKDLLERISYIQQHFDSATLVEEFIPGREIYVGVLGNERPEAFPIIEWDLTQVKDGPQIAGTEAKWDRDSDGYKAPVGFPDDIPDEAARSIQNAAIMAYQALKLSGYARVDMRLRKLDSPADAVRPGKEEQEHVESNDARDGKSASKEAEKGTLTKNGRETESGKNYGAEERVQNVARQETDRALAWDHPIIEVNPNCWLEKRGEFAAAARKHGLSYPDLLEKIIALALERRPNDSV